MDATSHPIRIGVVPAGRCLVAAESVLGANGGAEVLSSWYAHIAAGAWVECRDTKRALEGGTMVTT
jgi:hypothetical protein